MGFFALWMANGWNAEQKKGDIINIFCFPVSMAKFHILPSLGLPENKNQCHFSRHLYHCQLCFPLPTKCYYNRSIAVSEMMDAVCCSMYICQYSSWYRHCLQIQHLLIEWNRETGWGLQTMYTNFHVKNVILKREMLELLIQRSVRMNVRMNIHNTYWNIPI